jgi:YfiH family protein
VIDSSAGRAGLSNGSAERTYGSHGHADGWRVEERAGLLLLRCAAFEEIRSTRHAFSTRVGDGGACFDLGGPDDRSDTVVRRRRAFLAAAGLGGRRPTLLRQIHGATVLDSRELTAGPAGSPAADGVLAHAGSTTGLAPSVRWADCVPVLLAARDGRAVAAVHSGWRGTAAGVVPRAVARLGESGVGTDELVAAIGPSIGGCCYEVGEEVVAALARSVGPLPEGAARGGPDRRMLDLRGAVRSQLEAAGVPGDRIHVAPWCTACAADLFFSYRREGAAAGRQMACIGWPASGPP